MLVACLVIGLLYATCRHYGRGDGKPDEFYDTMDRMESVAQACEKYRRLVGAWPPNIPVLRSVIWVRDTNIFVDAWGHEIVFIAPTNAPAAMWLKSYGADGITNGFGSNADIFYSLP